MAFLLTGTEPRVKVTVSCVTWTWRLKDSVFDVVAPYNFAQGIGPRPFLMLMGRSDELLTAEQAQRIFDCIGEPTAAIEFFNSGHKLPPDKYIPEAVTWFKKHL